MTAVSTVSAAVPAEHLQTVPRHEHLFERLEEAFEQGPVSRDRCR